MSTAELTITQSFLTGFLSDDSIRLVLVVLPIVTGLIICALIAYDDHASTVSDDDISTSTELSNSTIPVAEPKPVTPEKSEHRHEHRNVTISFILAVFIGIMVIGGAIIATLDYYTYTATGEHLHLDLPLIGSSGDAFIDSSTFMILALIVGIFLILGIMLLAISLKPKPEELVGWTRPGPLTAEGRLAQRGFIDTWSQQPEPPPKPAARRYVCRYCNREIPEGRFCQECHLTSGW